MKLFGLTKIGVGSGLANLGGLLLALLSSTAPGCDEPASSEPMMTEPDIHPRTIFDEKVKPEMKVACGVCHSVAQGQIQAFFTDGMEYESITGYKSGVFLTADAVQSTLLQKGAHTGPAFTPEQYEKVKAWLEAEAAFRPSPAGGMTKSGLLPTAPITPGDFNMSFEKLMPIMDAQANITFTLEKNNNNVYRITNLKLTAGPSTGIRIVHPLIYFISETKSLPDPADSLSNIDMNVPSGTSALIGSGNVLLTNAPSQDPNTRIGIAFQILEKSDIKPIKVDCKAFAMFEPAVDMQLASCKASCHAQGRNNGAFSAWDMAQQGSTDPNVQKQFCISALGRIDKNTPANSIMIKQVTPAAQGGTANHPFKFTVAAQLTAFTNAVNPWAMGEK